nr:HlyD family efflux transporter periplasmic adaptor subunit [Lachnospiraceae bacterium]
AYDGMADTVSAEIESIQSMVSQNSDISEITSALTSAIATLNADNTTLKEYLKVYEDATDNLTACEDAEKTASSEYESAKSTYEKNHSNAEKEVESLTSEIETLQDKYDSLVNAQETSLLELENKYQKALLSAENAQTKYDSTITTLQAAVDEATTEYNDLLEEQEALLSCVNGVVHASQAGTLSSVNVTAEGYLMGDMAVVAYYDTSKIIISTEIDQAEISKVSVGDTVSVMITGSGMYEGTITEIATEATSGGSMSNVTYAVTVTIDNSDGALSAGSSAYVTFSYEEEGEEQNENE